MHSDSDSDGYELYECDVCGELQAARSVPTRVVVPLRSATLATKRNGSAARAASFEHGVCVGRNGRLGLFHGMIWATSICHVVCIGTRMVSCMMKITE